MWEGQTPGTSARRSEAAGPRSARRSEPDFGRWHPPWSGVLPATGAGRSLPELPPIQATGALPGLVNRRSSGSPTSPWALARRETAAVLISRMIEAGDHRMSDTDKPPPMKLIESGRVSRLARRWSNTELARFAGWFSGDVVNVSGWKDEDKQGAHYADYFTGKASYTITNYKAEARGIQGQPGEVFLDLEAPLDPGLAGRFDVVFNHTVLEHVYAFQTAFKNLCAMSRDVVIIVVPWLQPYHGDYGDYWRFSPLAVKKMYEESGLTPLYVSFNDDAFASVYVFAIGTRHPERWRDRFPEPFAIENAARRVAGQRSIVQGVRGALRVLRGK